MVFGNVKHLEEFSFLDSSVRECLDYFNSHDLASYEKGSHEIDGERLFVNVVEYTTTTPENRFWEAHREYLDIHVMIRGQEQINISGRRSVRSRLI